MGKFIQLTTKRIQNLPLDWADTRTFKICLNTDHILLVRPNQGGNHCVIFVDNICSQYRPESVDLDESGFEEEREDVRNSRAAIIIVEESFEQVRAMLC